MKKFSKFIICLLLCVFAFGVIGCKKNELDNGFHPSTDAIVEGNGGLAVRKGEYVYFANGFKKVSDLTDENRNGSFVKGGLYVAKLDETGNFVRDGNGLMVDDYIRAVNSKLAGYDATNLFVFGDYLYFVSPSNENESGKLNNSQWAKDRSVFYRVKLSNFDKVEEIYQANVKHENLSFQYYSKDGNVYLVVYEKGEDLNGDGNKNMLKRVDLQAKKNKVSTIASNVTSVVFGYNTDDNAYDRIHYVENTDNKYKLVRYNAATNNGTTVDQADKEIAVKFVSNNYVYATRNNGSETYMCRAEIGNALTEMFNSDSAIVGDLFLLPNGEDLISVRDNVIQFYLRGNRLVSTNYTIVDNDEKSVSKINVIGFANGSIIYYDNNNALKTVSYSDIFLGNKPEIKTLTTIEFNADFIDINGNDIYYFTGDSTGYLFKINVVTGSEGEMIGVYLDEDKPTTEDED